MRSIDEIIGGHEELSRENLIPLLQEIQREEGYVSHTAVRRVAQAVGMPPARVFGVATFYNQFRFVPLGTHVIQVCRGTACHVKQSLTTLQHLQKKLSLDKHGNSPDGKYTVITVACLGACSIAPVIKVDGEFFGHLDADKTDTLLAEIDARGAQA